VFAEIFMLLEAGAGTGIGVLGAVPADAEVIEIGTLDAGADEIGLGVGDFDGPPPVVVFASFAGFMGEIALNDLQCPQGMLRKF
jgi:hypothetical protein